MSNNWLSKLLTISSWSNQSKHLFSCRKTRCKSSGLTLDAEALLVLDDEVLLVVLELAQIILSVLGQQAKLLKGLIDLLVFLRHAVHHATHRRAWLSITKRDWETGEERRWTWQVWEQQVVRLLLHWGVHGPCLLSVIVFVYDSCYGKWLATGKLRAELPRISVGVGGGIWNQARLDALTPACGSWVIWM